MSDSPKSFPAFSLDDLIDGWRPYAEFFGHAPLRAARAFCHLLADIANLVGGQLTCDRLGTVFLHHQLVITVRHPCKVVDSVVTWASV